ncbi:low temperature requirement protein A [Streptomyces sp. CB01881]|uniref:low temperature requirement protein A n=1 Tax=Streptomyces sp. CB01881 TaxID=2078691 RepID=UPI000CDC2DDE|nr:low temperature requirement protein A [Streptomyces sp. CB01881]AUY51635.1 low temperature requirement protein A [Streptomyces sp. CB01881]TYC71069.1 low temperature requirement protein A [Streptomyces sp. CB01881]
MSTTAESGEQSTGASSEESNGESNGEAAEQAPERFTERFTEQFTDEKRVTWAELYFDLVFVFAITQVSGLLHHHHDWTGVVRALVVFVPVYWCWVGTTVQANIRDVDTPRDRMGILAVGLAGLFMALAVPGAYEGRGVLLGAGYWAARVVLLVLLIRVPGVWRGPYGVGVLVSGPLLLVGGLLPDGPRLVLWALAALCDLSGPVLFRNRLARVSYNPSHMPERFALFLLVALGESIVGIGATAAGARLDAAELVAVAAAFTISCGLWWQYFVYAADAMRHAVAVADSRRDVIRRVFQYGHLALVAGVIAVAVGFGETVADPRRALGAGSVALLYGGCGLYLLTFGYTRWMMFRAVSTTRIVAAVVVLGLAPVMVRLPAIAVLVTLAVLLVALNVVEHVRVERAAVRSAEAAPATPVTEAAPAIPAAPVTEAIPAAPVAPAE